MAGLHLECKWWPALLVPVLQDQAALPATCTM